MPTILLVDDEPDMRELVGMSIELTTSWKVRTAGSAAEAIEAVRGSRPDAIVLDMMMPDMDGARLLAAIRAIPGAADIPAVFLTGQSQPAAAGAAGVIRKPFDPHTIGSELSRILGWPA